METRSPQLEEQFEKILNNLQVSYERTVDEDNVCCYYFALYYPTHDCYYRVRVSIEKEACILAVCLPSEKASAWLDSIDQSHMHEYICLFNSKLPAGNFEVDQKQEAIYCYFAIPSSDYATITSFTIDEMLFTACARFSEFEIGIKDMINGLSASKASHNVENKTSVGFAPPNENKASVANKAVAKLEWSFPFIIATCIFALFLFIGIDSIPGLRYVSSKIELSFAHCGDTVHLGVYEQDGNIFDGKESIEWFVLDDSDGKLLLISKYILDAHKYDDKLSDWETSSLKSWLDSTFCDAAFTSSERALLAESPTCGTFSSSKGWDLCWKSNKERKRLQQYYTNEVEKAQFNHSGGSECKLTTYAKQRWPKMADSDSGPYWTTAAHELSAIHYIHYHFIPQCVYTSESASSLNGYLTVNSLCGVRPVIVVNR